MKHDDSPQRGYQSHGLEKTAWLRNLHKDVDFLAEREGDVEKNDEKVVQSRDREAVLLLSLPT